MKNQNKVLLAIVAVLKHHEVEIGTIACREILFETRRGKLAGLKPVVLVELEKLGGVRLRNWAIKNFEKLFLN